MNETIIYLCVSDLQAIADLIGSAEDLHLVNPENLANLLDSVAKRLQATLEAQQQTAA